MSRLALLTRTTSTFVRILEFMISALVLGIFSYYLAVLTRRHASIPTWEQASEGMSGAAVIYTGFAVVLTFFLGGIAIFALIAVILDVCFCGCFIAIAVFTRGGNTSCNNTGHSSPIGLGERTSCQLQRAVFAVSIVAAVLFLLSAFLQVALSRHHKKEARYGPGPSNNYTSGSGKRKFWHKKPKGAQDAELGAIGAGALAEEKHHKNNRNSAVRQSDDTTMTGTTASAPNTYGGPNTKYHNEPTLPANSTGYTPQTTGMTGAGYDSRNTGTNGAGAVPEMEDGALGSGQRPYERYDAKPYQEVHHGGFAHSNPESQGFAR